MDTKKDQKWWIYIGLLFVGVLGAAVIVHYVDQYGYNQIMNKPIGEVHKQSQKDGCSHAFADFPVQITSLRGDGGVDYSSVPYPVPEKYKVHLEEAMQQGPFFANRYRVAEWGCGTSCQNAALVDYETGTISAFGLRSTVGFDHRSDSALLIVNPKDLVERELSFSDTIAKNLETEYYVMTDMGLEFLCAENIADTGEEVCAQVVVSAKNEATGKEMTFSDPCDVPKNNWMVLPPGS